MLLNCVILLLLCLFKLLGHDFDCPLALHDSSVCFIQMLFHISSCSDCLNCKLFLPVPLGSQVIDLLQKFASVGKGFTSIFFCLGFGRSDFISVSSFCSEHLRKKVSVLFDLLKFVVQFLLEVDSLPQARHVPRTHLLLLFFSLLYFAL